jgi:type II secretory ATPase GspE/PulE/Tfp pilus assembly ATPase PilB-like protein
MNSETVPTLAKPALLEGSEERPIRSGEQAQHLLPYDEPRPVTPGTIGAGQAVVELQDGSRLVGALSGFDANNGVVALRLSGDRQQKIIRFDAVKIIHLPVLPQWIKAELLTRTGNQGARLPLEQQDFRIEFKDGDTLRDRTLGFRADRHGLYFLPTHDSHRSLCIFVPHCVIRGYSIGPDAGDMADSKCLCLEEMRNAAKVQPGKHRLPSRGYLQRQVVDSTDKLKNALDRQRKMPNIKLGEVLLKEGLITEEQLNAALQLVRQKQSQNQKQPLGEILVDQKLISIADLQYALAMKLGFPIVDLENFEMDYEAVKRVPEDLVRKYRILPLSIFGDTLAVAVDNPIASADALATVGFLTGLRVEAAIATRAEIDRVIDLAYTMDDPDSLSLDDFRLAQEYEADRIAEYEASDNVVVRLVNRLIISANNKGASDIHIEPDADGAKAIVRIRKDGTLIPFYEIPALLRRAIPARIKVMAGLDIGERRKPQDGKISFKKFGKENIELRVATMPTVGGQEDVVLRILSGGKPLPLEKLGLSQRNHQQLMPLIEKPYGMIIVCGPTGSGKTTTLHSILALLNIPDRKIWTVEDPVEIVQKGLRQVQVHAKIGLDFATVMRSFLRADPDVIMLGEMRDRETAATGIEASLTGHLVFSTLHTNNAPESIVRLLEMGMDPFNFADSLLGILAQRLTKCLCSNCKAAYQPENDELNSLLAEYCRELDAVSTSKAQVIEGHEKILREWKQRFADSAGRFTLYRTVGCQQCDNTGYKGRAGIHELLIAGDTVKRQIVESAPVADILATAISEGMQTLKQDGIEKVLQGVTDILQVRKVCIK